jgi:hypothetical protein
MLTNSMCVYKHQVIQCLISTRYQSSKGGWSCEWANLSLLIYILTMKPNTCWICVLFECSYQYHVHDKQHHYLGEISNISPGQLQIFKPKIAGSVLAFLPMRNYACSSSQNHAATIINQEILLSFVKCLYILVYYYKVSDSNHDSHKWENSRFLKLPYPSSYVLWHNLSYHLLKREIIS